jgi:haloalkane dehalogenase
MPERRKILEAEDSDFGGGAYSTMEEAHRALAESTYPKLLFVGDPGSSVSPAFGRSFAKGLTNCRLVQLSSGIHYLQEDHPDLIGSEVKEWLVDLGVGRGQPTLRSTSISAPGTSD